MAPTENRRITLKRRPTGLPTPSDFRLISEPLTDISDGEILIQNCYLGMSPSARIRIGSEQGYAPPLDLGETMPCPSVGRVIASKHPGLDIGDVVTAFGGWQEYYLSDGGNASKFDTSLGDMPSALGILGTSGFTAWAGLRSIPEGLAPDETIVVTAASGAVGSLVCQLARLKGARVIGIAGGREKCDLVRDQGADACVDYKSDSFLRDIASACPDGVDVYFDNVGGPIRDTIWDLMNTHGRILVCGLISEYQLPSFPPGPAWLRLLGERLTLRGFLLGDHFHLRDQFLEEMSALKNQGLLKYREDLHNGLDAAPAAFIDMLRGYNLGKTIVKLAD